MDTRIERGGARAGADPVPRKWRGEGAGERYSRERWRAARRARRDPAQVERLLARHLSGRAALVLDAPCGTGRLAPVLRGRARRYVGLDASPAMLAAFAAPSSGERLRGDLFALPFATGSFDAVVCCRLLHHLREPEELRRALAELVRASAELVVASFWDAGSLPALRRRVVPGARPPRRHAHPRSLVTTLLAELGANVLEFRADLRFLTRQTFFVARKRRERG